MAQPILLKRSSVIGKIPVTANLQYGELSINYADGALYYLTSNNTINSFVSNGSSFASNILTANLFSVAGNTTISSSILTTSRGVIAVTGNADGTYISPNNNGVMLHITGQVNQPGRLFIDGQGNGAYSAIVGRSYNGTTATPTGMLAGNTVFRLGSTPYHSTGWPSISTTRIDYIADELQTATTLGSRMEFTYTPQGTAATTLGARLGSNGFFTYGNTVVANATPSTSTTTGALQVAGGAGIAGNLWAGNVVTTNGVFWANGAVYGVTQIIAGSNITISPTNGIGAVTINAAGGGGGSAFTGGYVPNQSTFGSNLVANSGAVSTGTTTGALVVTGGVGVSGNLYILNAGDVSANIGVLYANAVAQQGTINSINANVGVLYSGNIATQANIGVLYANAISQQGQISNLVSTANANTAAYLTTYTGNLSASNITTTGNLFANTAGTKTTVANLVTTNGVFWANGVAYSTGGGGTTFTGGYVANQSTFSSNLVANSATTSTSTTTGALVVTGGAGISGNLNVGGNVIATILSTSGSKIALGIGTGGSGQQDHSVAIGYYAGYQTQGISSVAIGDSAGSQQGNYSVAIVGGTSHQGNSAVAIGLDAASTDQSDYSVAIGSAAGKMTQGSSAVAMGYNAGQTSQGISSVAIGTNSGNDTQGVQSVAIGSVAGQTSQSDSSVAVGLGAGNYHQGTEAVSIGKYAGATSQSDYSVAIGSAAGWVSQGNSSVAIGSAAGQTTQGVAAVAIGGNAGNDTQGVGAIAIGADTGKTAQGMSAVAIGGWAGNDSQGEYAIAIGQNAGENFQGNNSIAIGYGAGFNGYGTNAIAIGTNAGQNQDNNSIAIGQGAGAFNQPANSIIINADSNDLNGNNSGFYVNPVRNDTGNVAQAVYYNTTTKELTYASPASGGTPGGSSGAIQFNNSGTFGGSGLNYFSGNNTVTTGNIQVSSVISTVDTNGNLTIDPNGSGSAIFSQSTPVIVSNTTTSTSNVTGALVVNGGIGVTGNIYVSSNVYIAGARALTSADLAATTFTANYITQNPLSSTALSTIAGTSTSYGTYNFGNVQSIQIYGDYDTVANTGFYSVNDATGTPAHVEYIGFTNVSTFNQLDYSINYTASSGHTINIDLYNYQYGGWDTFATYTGVGSWQTFTLGLINAAPYIGTTVGNVGNVTTRLYHISSGNVQHRTWIDYVALQNTLTGSQGPRGATGATGATGPSGSGTFGGGYVGNVTTFSANVVANSATDSTGITSGAVVVTGGVGVSGNVNIGGDLNIAGTIYDSGVAVPTTGKVITTMQGWNLP